MTRGLHLPLAAALSVPSPLAGEGQGEGCHATCSLDLRLNHAPHFLTPSVWLPLSPALPRKGGGSPAALAAGTESNKLR
jgi:hypothetical protein